MAQQQQQKINYEDGGGDEVLLYVPVTKGKAATVRMSMSIITVPKITHTWILSFLTLISLSRSITFSGSGHSTLIESDVFSRCIKESDVLASRDFAFPRVAPRVTDTLEPRDFNLKFSILIHGY